MRTELSDNKSYLIGKDNLKAIMEKATAAASSHATTLATVTATDSQTLVTPDSCVTELEDIKKLIATASKANELHETEDRTTFRVTLDDAVEVLSDIKVEDETVPRQATMLRKRRSALSRGPRWSWLFQFPARPRRQRSPQISTR